MSDKSSEGTPTGPDEGQRIDWNAIQRRMASAQRSLAQVNGPSPKDRLNTLRQRARSLAQEPVLLPAQESLNIVEFRLSSETYGIESAYVREIIPLKDFTPLPGVPPFVLGIVNVRGQILSVIDLKVFFSLPQTSLGQLNKLIILRHEQMEFGVLADAILGIRTLAPGAIRPSPPSQSGVGAGYLRGIATDRLIVLDAKRILDSEHIVVDQRGIV